MPKAQKTDDFNSKCNVFKSGDEDRPKSRRDKLSQSTRIMIPTSRNKKALSKASSTSRTSEPRADKMTQEPLMIIHMLEGQHEVRLDDNPSLIEPELQQEYYPGLNGFFLFRIEMGHRDRERMQSELCTLLGKQWNALSPKAQQKYETKAARLKYENVARGVPMSKSKSTAQEKVTKEISITRATSDPGNCQFSINAEIQRTSMSPNKFGNRLDQQHRHNLEPDLPEWQALDHREYAYLHSQEPVWSKSYCDYLHGHEYSLMPAYAPWEASTNASYNHIEVDMWSENNNATRPILDDLWHNSTIPLTLVQPDNTIPYWLDMTPERTQRLEGVSNNFEFNTVNISTCLNY